MSIIDIGAMVTAAGGALVILSFAPVSQLYSVMPAMVWSALVRKRFIICIVRIITTRIGVRSAFWWTTGTSAISGRNGAAIVPGRALSYIEMLSGDVSA